MPHSTRHFMMSTTDVVDTHRTVALLEHFEFTIVSISTNSDGTFTITYTKENREVDLNAEVCQ